MLIIKSDPFQTSCKTPLPFFHVSSLNNACHVTVHLTGPQLWNSSSKRWYRNFFPRMYHLICFQHHSGFSRQNFSKLGRFFLLKYASTLILSCLLVTSRVLLNAVAKASWWVCFFDIVQQTLSISWKTSARVCEGCVSVDSG